MFKLTVQDVFFIRNRGVVATGRVESGKLRDIEKSQIPQGAVITAAGEFPSIEESPFIV